AAAQAKQSVEEALRKGDLSAAASALAEARKLAPRDPALARLGQELAQAQMQAVREKTQMDARAKLEAEAQARLAAMKKVEQSKINELLTKAREAIVQKNFSDAEKLIAEALSLDSTNLSGARLQRELREVRQAEAQAKTAMSAAERKKREEEKARNKVEFNRLMKEGKEALATEDMDKDIELFTQAKKLNTDDADVALYLGMARRHLEREKLEEQMKRREEEERKAEAARMAKA
ncbi:MAG TPA: hypothetical protein PKD72_14325, partial [Gemmatales bacterium]|nr:hypothetical protein [Gemmatales bacterium]